MDFETWWNETGSGILPLPGADMEEHGKLVAGEAWDAAIKGFLEAWEHGLADASAEIDRLKQALCAANAMAERFERGLYLSKNEIEKALEGDEYPDFQPTCSKQIP